jgi:hypothetical protein
LDSQVVTQEFGIDNEGIESMALAHLQS